MNIKEFYDKAYTWILAYGPRLLIAVIMLVAGLWIVKRISNITQRVLVKRRIDPSVRPFFSSLLSSALQIVLVLAIMQVLGIQLTVFAALIGAFGVAAGLALSGTLQNFTSGVLILIMKPFRIGDNIIAQSQEGTVTTIRIFYTVVTTFDNRTVIIPNGKLSNEVIVNLSREGRRRVDLEMKFSYVVPFEQVKAVAAKTFTENKDLLKDPAYRVGITGMEADGYTILANAWVKAHGYVDVKMELYEALIAHLIAAGIKLPGL